MADVDCLWHHAWLRRLCRISEYCRPDMGCVSELEVDVGQYRHPAIVCHDAGLLLP